MKYVETLFVIQCTQNHATLIHKNALNKTSEDLNVFERGFYHLVTLQQIRRYCIGLISLVTSYCNNIIYKKTIFAVGNVYLSKKSCHNEYDSKVHNYMHSNHCLWNDIVCLVGMIAIRNGLDHSKIFLGLEYPTYLHFIVLELI